MSEFDAAKHPGDAVTSGSNHHTSSSTTLRPLSSGADEVFGHVTSDEKSPGHQNSGVCFMQQRSYPSCQVRRQSCACTLRLGMMLACRLGSKRLGMMTWSAWTSTAWTSG